MRMMDGFELEGRIKNFDRFAVVLDHAGADHMIFKHAIAAIRTPKPVANYFSHSSGVAAPFTRAIVIVLDGVGIGELPDARAYGDRAATRSATSRARVPLTAADAARARAWPRGRARRTARRPVDRRGGASAAWRKRRPARTRSPDTGR